MPSASLSVVSDTSPTRAERRLAREPKLPSDRDWERAALLQPLAGGRHPEFVSDGGEVSFALASLTAAQEPLDEHDPAVVALLTHLSERSASPAGWRVLARREEQTLFACATPTQLLIVKARRGGLRRRWKCVGPSAAAALRATREGIRASSWRPDPTHPLDPDAGELRVLVTEQAFAGGQRADGRVLAPDVYLDAQELVLRMFVTPRPGFQGGAPNPETPVRIALPQPLGARALIDGALVHLTA